MIMNRMLLGSSGARFAPRQMYPMASAAGAKQLLDAEGAVGPAAQQTSRALRTAQSAFTSSMRQPRAANQPISAQIDSLRAGNPNATSVVAEGRGPGVQPYCPDCQSSGDGVAAGQSAYEACWDRYNATGMSSQPSRILPCPGGVGTYEVGGPCDQYRTNGIASCPAQGGNLISATAAVGVQTIQNADGTTTVLTVNADGSATAVTTNADGSVTTITRDVNGNETTTTAAPGPFGLPADWYKSKWVIGGAAVLAGAIILKVAL